LATPGTGTDQPVGPGRHEPVDELIAAIISKLEAKRDVLRQSLGHGRLTWRRVKSGKIELDLDVKL
jgi:hypothetical protein